jgi:hypothetical protein
MKVRKRKEKSINIYSSYPITLPTDTQQFVCEILHIQTLCHIRYLLPAVEHIAIQILNFTVFWEVALNISDTQADFIFCPQHHILEDWHLNLKKQTASTSLSLIPSMQKRRLLPWTSLCLAFLCL